MVLHVVIEGLHNGLVDWDPQHEDVLRECQVCSQQRYPLSRQIMDAVRQRLVHWRDKTAKGQDSTASEAPSRLQQLLDEMSPKYSLFQLNTGGVGITQTTIQAGDVVIELAGPEASEGVVVCCILRLIDPRSHPHLSRGDCKSENAFQIVGSSLLRTYDFGSSALIRKATTIMKYMIV